MRVSCALILSLSANAAGPNGQAVETLGLPGDSDLRMPDPVEAVAVGKKLFFDARLSSDGSVSCASCHRPELAFTDGRKHSVGVGGRTGTRNAPSLTTAAFSSFQSWDGRNPSLELQVLDPFVNPREHGLASHESLLTQVGADSQYGPDLRRAFRLAAEQEIGLHHVQRALVAYVRTLAVGGSAFDRFMYGGDKDALTPSALRGLRLFSGRAQCTSCHTIGPTYATFQDNAFHNLGIAASAPGKDLAAVAKRVATTNRSQLVQIIHGDAEVAALGRFLVTLDPQDIGRFKTPSLRNVALTAPYMHDGSVPDLQAAIEREAYYRGLSTGKPLILTPSEREDLVAFLRSLTSFSVEGPSGRESLAR